MPWWLWQCKTCKKSCLFTFQVMEKLRSSIYEVAARMTVNGTGEGSRIMGEQVPFIYQLLERELNEQKKRKLQNQQVNICFGNSCFCLLLWILCECVWVCVCVCESVWVCLCECGRSHKSIYLSPPQRTKQRKTCDSLTVHQSIHTTSLDLVPSLFRWHKLFPLRCPSLNESTTLSCCRSQFSHARST